MKLKLFLFLFNTLLFFSGNAQWLNIKPVRPTIDFFEYFQLMVAGGNTIVAGGQLSSSGLFISVDNGLNWKNSNVGNSFYSAASIAIVGSIIFLGLYFGAALPAALSASAAITCAVCPECCSGDQGHTYDYPDCPNCPSPYIYDGANCYLFSPPVGSNPWFGNGNFYWDDPSHSCNPPGSQAYWDGAHCTYALPVGKNYFPFIWHGGFYIKCP